MTDDQLQGEGGISMLQLRSGKKDSLGVLIPGVQLYSRRPQVDVPM